MAEFPSPYEFVKHAFETVTYDGKLLSEWVEEIKKHTWISVKERLPDKKQNVLYFVDGYGVRLGRYNYTGVTGVVWFTTRLGGRAGSAGSTTAATHWMPLPEPPKEELSYDKAIL